MLNRYLIELNGADKQVKATVWVPGNALKTKQDFIELFDLIGSVMYGAETKAKKDAQSYSATLALIKAQNKKEPKDI